MISAPSIGWGVLGAARITRRGFLPGLRQSRNGHLAVVGSQSGISRAAAVTEEFGCGRPVACYEEVLEDPAVDAVYVPLPNSLHYPWVLRALAAGKHVLCEKPLALGSSQVEDITKAAEAAGLTVMEAFMYRFHPQYERAAWENLLQPLGPLRTAEIHFSEPMEIPGDIREDPALGGGALWDIGCYCLDVLCWQFGEVDEVQAFGEERSGCNWTTSTQLRFMNGRTATCWWSFSGPMWQRMTLVGTRGILTLHDPFRPGGRTTTVLESDGVTRTIRTEGDDCFRREIEHFGDLVTKGEDPAIPLTGTGRWIRLAEEVEKHLGRSRRNEA